MPLIGHRLPLLCAPVLASPGVPRAPVSPQRLDDSWHTIARVPGHREQHARCGQGSASSALAKATPMSQRTAHRRHQALDHYLAEDKLEDICRHLACSKSWLYTWRNRYDATNPAWGQERLHKTQALTRPTRPTTSHRAVVSLPCNVTPQRHRRERHRHHAGAHPARDRAGALPTHPVPSSPPPSHGGEITQVQRIQSGSA